LSSAFILILNIQNTVLYVVDVVSELVRVSATRVISSVMH